MTPIIMMKYLTINLGANIMLIFLHTIILV